MIFVLHTCLIEGVANPTFSSSSFNSSLWEKHELSRFCDGKEKLTCAPSASRFGINFRFDSGGWSPAFWKYLHWSWKKWENFKDELKYFAPLLIRCESQQDIAPQTAVGFLRFYFHFSTHTCADCELFPWEITFVRLLLLSNTIFQSNIRFRESARGHVVL